MVKVFPLKVTKTKKFKLFIEELSGKRWPQAWLVEEIESQMWRAGGKASAVRCRSVSELILRVANSTVSWRPALAKCGMPVPLPPKLMKIQLLMMLLAMLCLVCLSSSIARSKRKALHCWPRQSPSSSLDTSQGAQQRQS